MIENPNPTEEGRDKYLMVAKLQTPEEHQTEDTDGEISIKTSRQRGRYTKEEPPVKEEYHERQSPRWTSKNASKRAKEAIEHDKLKQKLEEKKAEAKVKALRNSLSTVV